MSEIYDAIIIGGGPAGYTAAIYIARAGLKALVLEPATVGGQMASAGLIENYSGFEGGIDGYDLGVRMQNEAHRFGAVTKYEMAKELSADGEIKRVGTDLGNEYQSRAVILAMGASPKKLLIKGEDRYIGSGVHYCAHCDGGFYKGKDVVVIGGGNSAVSDALYLSGIARSVTLIHRRDRLKAHGIEVSTLLKRENVSVLYNTTPVALVDEGGAISGIRVSASGEERELKADGIFIAIGRVPQSELIKDILPLDESGYVIAGEDTETAISGIFVAGDLRAKPLRQIVTATADGAVAADGVIRLVYRMN